ncbi:MAG TPA: flagellar hook-basal body protein [Candidatus Ozemobacteraceae bacterium]|nr:flagellar hook-basal body protein [Candidatus Ozemobacteraceae bacterium]
MIRGIYTSASSMLVETIRQDMIANNLANVDTVGYKRDQGIFKELPTMMLRKVNDGQLYPPRPLIKYPKIGKLGTGVILDESYTDFSMGNLQHTENDLDCALDNAKAFFLVESPNGIRYSRDGVFNVNQDGYLTNMNGDYIMTEPEPQPNADEKVLVKEDGTPNLEMGRAQFGPTDKITIDTEGRVLVNGAARFRIVRGQAADRKAFRKENTNNFTRAYGDVQRADGKVKVGYVEKPNFSLVEEMVKMIEVSRAYEANSKCIQAHDSLLDKVVNSVGPTRR